MPQIFTNILNDSIEDGAFDPFAVGQQDSLSVRLEKMQEGTFAEIHGVNWGSVTLNAIPTTNLFGVLLIIRNHIFDPNIAYGLTTVSSFLDVVYKDNVSRFRTKRSFDFNIPLRLEGAANYLIVASGFSDPDIIAPSTMQAYLSVRGKIIQISSNRTYWIPR